MTAFTSPRMLKIIGSGVNTPGARNLISGNGDEGISLDGADNNRVSGNYIGTNAAGTAILGNADFGIVLGNGAQNNTIGGDTVPLPATSSRGVSATAFTSPATRPRAT